MSKRSCVVMGKFELGEFDGSPAGGLVDIKMTIPLDGGAAVATFKGLKAAMKDNCVASQFTIAAAPNGSPECGCVATMFKP